MLDPDVGAVVGVPNGALELGDANLGALLVLVREPCGYLPEKTTRTPDTMLSDIDATLLEHDARAVARAQRGFFSRVQSVRHPGKHLCMPCAPASASVPDAVSIL